MPTPPSFVSSLMPGILKALAAGTGAEAIAPGTGTAVTATVGGLDVATAGLKKFEEKLSDLTKGFENFEAKSKEAFGGLIPGGLWFESFVNIATKMQEAGAELQRQTGAVEKLGAAWGGAGFGMSMKEAATSIAGLNNSFVDLNQMSDENMKMISKQAMGLTRLGITAEETGKSYTLMAKAMQMTEKEMKKTQDKIAKAALSLGVAPKKMAQDYNKIIPQLMHWGKSSTDVFLKLAANAKATGVEMDALLKVAAGFDTFDEAAEKTGKLNMLLGGPYLNTVQMIKADESERLELLKKSIQLTGKSVDQLGRWRVRDIAKEMGFTNLADFYKEMGAPQSVIDKFKKKISPAQLAQENLNKAISKGVKISEVWTAWFEKMGAIIGGPFLRVMGRFGKWMRSGEGGKGITEVFTWFADGIDRLLKGWDEMGPALKGAIVDFATFGLKMVGTSVAVKGFMQIIRPMLQLFTSPSSGLIAVTTWLITNWDGWAGTVKNLRNQFYDLSDTINSFLNDYADDAKWGPLISPLRDLWKIIDEDIMGALPDMNSQFGGWQKLWKDFVLTLKDAWTQISGFFTYTIQGAKSSENSFIFVIRTIKKEIFAFIGDVITEIENQLLKRFGGMLQRYAADRQGMAPDWLANQRDPRGFAMGQGMQFAGAARGAKFTRISERGTKHLVGGLEAGTEFGKLVYKEDIVGAMDSPYGQFVQQEIQRMKKKNISIRGFDAGSFTGDFWTDATRIRSFMTRMAERKETGGKVTANKPTTFGKEEGLIYAPNGNAYVMAASMMNGGQGGGGGDVVLQIDGRELARAQAGNNANAFNEFVDFTV